jgi:hypothetical protein
MSAARRAPRSAKKRVARSVRPQPRSPKRTRARTSSAKRPRLPIEVREVESLRGELERVARAVRPPRWNADPEDVRRSVAKLVLTLVELIRQLLERQALRRVDAGTLTASETEAVGLALMRLEQTVREIATQFDLAIDDLNLDLGPVGKLI